MALRTVCGALSLAFLVGGMASASAQGILDRMKEDAQRRAENKAAMDAEHQQDSKAAPAAAAPAATTAPATPAPSPAAPAAPAAQAAPAAPATPVTAQ